MQAHSYTNLHVHRSVHTEKQIKHNIRSYFALWHSIELTYCGKVGQEIQKQQQEQYQIPPPPSLQPK